jgi:hypothetical protein
MNRKPHIVLEPDTYNALKHLAGWDDTMNDVVLMLLNCYVGSARKREDAILRRALNGRKAKK